MKTKPDCKAKPPCCSKLKAIIVGTIMSLTVFAVSIYFGWY